MARRTDRMTIPSNTGINTLLTFSIEDTPLYIANPPTVIATP